MLVPNGTLISLPCLIFRRSPSIWIRTFLAFLLRRSELSCCVSSLVVYASLNLMLALLFLLRSSGPRTCLVLISAERGGYLLGGLLIAQGALSLLWLDKSAKDIVCRAVLGRLRMPIVLRSLLALLLLCLLPCLLGYGGLLLGCKSLLGRRACSCAIRATKTRPSVGA